MNDSLICLQVLIATSIFFVWVVRYDNIVVEFKQFGLPDGLRDSVGIFKLAFAVLLLLGIERPSLAVIGNVGIAILMAAAFATHLKVKNPVHKMLPSLMLLLISIDLAWMNYGLLKH
jgi:hypothetical protein